MYAKVYPSLGNSFARTPRIIIARSLLGVGRFIACNFAVLHRLHSLSGSDYTRSPAKKCAAACIVALVVVFMLVNFVACVAAAVFNGQM